MKIRRLAPLTGLALLLPLASCSDAVSPEPAAPPLVPAASHACDGSLPWFGTYYVGSDPNANLEVDGKLDTGCGYMVVTGVKGRIVSDSNYETMWLTGRMLYHDGTWGGETTRVYDVDGIVSHSWEMEAKVPDGHAVIGIGIGQSGTNDTLKRLVLKSRQVGIVDGHLQLVGPVFTTDQGTGSLDTGAYHELTGDREVYIGLGLRSNAERTRTIRPYTGVLY